MAERVSLPDGPIKFRWVAFVHGRPMVDSRCQGRGIGRAAMGLVAEDVRHKGVALVLLVPFVPVYGSQERFYLRLGLHPTGRSQDGEVVLELPLASITA